MLAGLTVLMLSAADIASSNAKQVVLPDTQIEPVSWGELEGWAADDQLAAFQTFVKSCRPILRGTPAMRAARPMYGALHHVCGRAVEAKPKTAAEARAFFEQNFRPVRIAPLGQSDGFLTGYYEPIVEGSLEKDATYTEPLYRKPASLLKGGRMLRSATFGARKGKAKRASRKLVPFHDRAAIEDGVLSGRNLEICYLKDPIDSFFIHIQGSARVRLADGNMMRLNYDSQNGHAYTAVGRFLIERNIVPREEMSMDRIRQWMMANPEEARELRRLNKSYVFFRETKLTADEEAMGAQGIPLTAWRSIAVDRKLHVYGTPFYISAKLPIDSEQSTNAFNRLMVAQDTGGAIVGPARADIYLGAGDEAGKISGRFKNPGRFVMLFPNEIDPAKAAHDLPLPRPRPSAAIATAKPPSAQPAKDTNERAKEPGASSRVTGHKPAAKPHGRPHRKPRS